jgi:RNA polymerase sigma-70 factor (ECF subfamily)
MLDEAELLAAWRAGDRDKGKQLFERHFDALYRFFGTKVDASEVADLVQKTFLACVEASESFDRRSSVRTYFLAIARHQLFHHYRSRRRRPSIDFHVSSIEDLAPSPSSVAARNEGRALVREALRRVPLELQIALELRYVEELTGPELALALDVPEGTVRSRLRRGLEALRAELDRLAAPGGGLAPTPAAEVPRAELERWIRDTPPAE